MTIALCCAITAWALLGVMCGITIGDSRNEVPAPAGLYTALNIFVCATCLIVLILRGAGLLP